MGFTASQFARECFFVVSRGSFISFKVSLRLYCCQRRRRMELADMRADTSP